MSFPAKTAWVLCDVTGGGIGTGAAIKLSASSCSALDALTILVIGELLLTGQLVEEVGTR